MKLISCRDGALHTLQSSLHTFQQTGRQNAFVTGLEAFDALAPDGAFSRGGVHELLSDSKNWRPLLVAAVMARAAASQGNIVWYDPHNELFLPALTSHGIALERLYLLRPPSSQSIWAIAECLRCKGVGATVAVSPRLSRVEARRFQLAAESSGSVGILLRTNNKSSTEFAAVTRWLVAPALSEGGIVRWKIELLHGHGGRIGQTVFLEYCRETHSLRAVEKLAHHRRDSPQAGVA